MSAYLLSKVCIWIKVEDLRFSVVEGLGLRFKGCGISRSFTGF